MLVKIIEIPIIFYLNFIKTNSEKNWNIMTRMDKSCLEYNMSKTLKYHALQFANECYSVRGSKLLKTHFLKDFNKVLSFLYLRLFHDIIYLNKFSWQYD